MVKRNVAYIRVANKDDDIVKIQKTMLDYYAKKKGFEIDYYYIDNGYSGTNFDRPQLKKLLKDIRSGEVLNRIIVRDFSRLSRNIYDLINIENEISMKKIKLISTNEENSLMFKLNKTLSTLILNCSRGSNKISEN